MAQDSLSVANGTGAAVRAAINAAMQASATNQSGSSAPSTTYAFQFFADTNTNTLKIRNAANNAYINVSDTGQIGAANLGLLPLTGGTISGNLIVSGDLTVNGSTTTIDTTTLTVEDKNIELGKVSSPSDTTADGGGITLLGSTNHTFNWINSTDSWTSSEHIALPDNKKLQLGAGQDLQIYHDGTNSFIKNNSGQLELSGPTNAVTSISQLKLVDGEAVLRGKAGENSVKCSGNNNVELYFDNSKKIETTNSGATVTGSLGIGTSSPSTILHINSSNNTLAFFESTDPFAAMYMADTNGSVGFVTTLGKLEFRTGGDASTAGTNATAKMILDSSGNLNIPNDTGKLQLGTSQDLQIYHDGSHSYIEDAGTGQLRLKTGQLTVLSTADETMIKAQQNNEVELYYDNVLKLETTSTGVDVTGVLTTDGATHNGDVNFFGSNYGAFWDKSASALKILDNAKLIMGTGQDLELYHNGSNTFIDNSTGITNIRGGTHKFRKLSDNEDMLILTPNDSVELYFDNSKKLETTSTGVDVTSRVNITGANEADVLQLSTGNAAGNTFAGMRGDNEAGIRIRGGGSGRGGEIELAGGGRNTEPAVIKFSTTTSTSFTTRMKIDADGHVLIPNDNKKLQIGTGQDLEIYHDGTDSYIDSSTNDLFIRSNGDDLILRASDDIFLQPAGGGENGITVVGNGGVELYYDNSKKLETRSGGLGVFGHIEAGDNNKLMLGDANDLQIYHSGTASFISNITACTLLLQNEGNIQFEAKSGEDSCKMIPHGGVELYYDNVKKFETVSDGVKITAAEGGEAILSIHADEADDNADQYRIRVPNNDGFRIEAGSSHETALKLDVNAGVELYYDNSKKFQTTTNGILTSGRAEIDGNCFPYSDNNNSLGIAGNRWTTVFATNATINTSDKNEKNTIVESDLGLDFINQLKPISYKWNKDDGKTHYGLIAQDIEETLTNVGKTIADFGGIFKEPNSAMGLSYTELIAPLIKAVQELSAEVAALKAS